MNKDEFASYNGDVISSLVKICETVQKKDLIGFQTEIRRNKNLTKVDYFKDSYLDHILCKLI